LVVDLATENRRLRHREPDGRVIDLTAVVTRSMLVSGFPAAARRANGRALCWRNRLGSSGAAAIEPPAQFPILIGTLAVANNWTESAAPLPTIDC
jgi:hypothetical protein